MKIYSNFSELVGSTPIMRLGNIEKKYNANATLLAKLEYFNPAGSIKDRVALNMIDDAEKSGNLKPGATIIEPTSGNTGIGLAAVAAQRGYKVILTMPESMSVERRNLLKAYGAEIVLTKADKGMTGAIEKANELAAQIEGSFIAGQFTNPANPQAHYLTTGPEIWNDTDGKIDILVSGIGTGGTISGIGKYLKEKNSNIKIVGVEPANSPLITKGVAGPHGLQGIGANFIPKTLDMTVVDEIITVFEENAYTLCKDIAKSEGLLVGITSGAAVFAAISLSKMPENFGKTITIILPDTGVRYMSTPAFAD